MFQAELENYRATRARTLKLLDGLTQAQLDYRAAADKWSVGEVADHLVLAGQLYLGEIAQLIALAEGGRTPVINRTFAELDVAPGLLPKSLLPFFELPFSALNLFVPRAAREAIMRWRVLPARHPQVATPRRDRSVAELRADLTASMAATETLLVQHHALDYRALILRHPLLGNNNALQLLRLAALHEERHQAQIAEALADAALPRAA